jgi:hypothetical protein
MDAALAIAETAAPILQKIPWGSGMTEATMPQGEQPDWRGRTLTLLLVGAIAAWLVWWIMDLDTQPWRGIDPATVARRSAEATGIAVAAVAFGFGLERVRIGWTIGFALALGLVAGLIVWWNNQPSGLWDWSGASLLLAIAIAVPLFQVARDEGRWWFPYTQIHSRAWTNVVLWCACWAFAGLSILLTFLMSELFKLIGITILHDLLQNHGWFPALILGGAFGAALGLFRDRDTVVRLLQRVVTGVLSVLAPVLGAGLVIFLLSLPFTGLHTLWDATKSTTPILITCVIGALILANAVIGHGPEDEAKNPILRWGAMALGVSMLPLAIVAAIATGLRIDQYGFTPDRLWALVFVILASTYGLVYLVALIRRRQNWALQVRPDNIRLAFATMALALLLATPLIGFNSISANSQVARLTSGKVPPENFDWRALAFDFGQPGKEAVKRLQLSRNAAIRTGADKAATAKERYDLKTDVTPFTGSFVVYPAGSTLPAELKPKLTDPSDETCTLNAVCRVFLQADGKSAIVLNDNCATLPPQQRNAPKITCSVTTERFVLDASGWRKVERFVAPPAMTPEQQRDALGRERAAIERGDVTVRTVQRKQVFIGDKAVGDPFE